MKARDIFEAACGRDVYGDNRSLVKVQTEYTNRNDLEAVEEDHIDMDNPIVEIHQNARLTLVNLMFEETDDPDFIYLSDMLRRFQTSVNSVDDKRMPGIAVTIMPKEIEGSFIHGMSGIAVVQASEDGGDLDMLSLVFTNDCIQAYLLDMVKDEEDMLDLR